MQMLRLYIINEGEKNVLEKLAWHVLGASLNIHVCVSTGRVKP